MSQHTPGPWCIGGELISRRGTATEIASVWSTRPERRDAPAQTEADANARLIAAAPEMLEALRALVEADSEEHYKTSEDTGWIHRAEDCAFCAAEAAIAKAEGRAE